MSARKAKEAFVRGFSGSTREEVTAIVLLVPLLALTHACLARLIRRDAANPTRPLAGAQLAWPSAHHLWRFSAEFIALVLPELAVMMSVVDPRRALAVSAAMATVALLLSACYGKPAAGADGTSPAQHRQQELQEIIQGFTGPHKTFISSYRAAMMMNTCMAILAVDFRSFPRRFVKAEVYGTGLMDVGVGSFVFSNGVCSAGRHSRGSQPPGKQQLSTLSSVVPLIILGLVRLVATRAVGYQEHASEYGEHWNFFLTLAAVALLTSLFRIPSRARLPLGAALLIAHQTALSWVGLSAIVHSEARGPGILSRNKEGLLSIPGYWALHLLSAGIGDLLQSSVAVAASAAFMPSVGGEGRCQVSLRPLYSWAIQWGFAAVALNALTTIVAGAVEPVSRRACNAAYICWMLGFNLQVLVAFAFVQLLGQQRVPRLLESVNRSMLAIFLAANLLTGLINLRTDTLGAADWLARLTVGGYMLVLSLFAELRSSSIPRQLVLSLERSMLRS